MTTTRLQVPLVALAVLLAATACSGESRRPAPPSVAVTVAPVQRRPVPYEVSAIGTVTPVRSVSVRSQVGGILMRTGFEEGDDVVAGQVLFEIDPRPFQAAHAQAEAVLARDLAQLSNALEQVQRYEELSRTQLTSREALDQYRTTAEALRAAVRADSAAVENARLNLEYSTIRARISGRAGDVLVRDGNLVRVNEAGPLVIINQLRPIAVRFAVPQQYLGQVRSFSARRRLDVLIRPSQDTTVQLRGTLTFIDNQVDTTTGTVELKANFPNADLRLWPGEFVTVRLVLDVEQDALTIPLQAVVTGQAGTFVYVLDEDGTARTQPVTIRRNLDDEVVIEGGLEPGQRVVTDGQLRLRPGARVEIMTAGGERAPGGSPRGARPARRGEAGR